MNGWHNIVVVAAVVVEAEEKREGEPSYIGKFNQGRTTQVSVSSSNITTQYECYSRRTWKERKCHSDGLAACYYACMLVCQSDSPSQVLIPKLFRLCIICVLWNINEGLFRMGWIGIDDDYNYKGDMLILCLLYHARWNCVLWRIIIVSRDLMLCFFVFENAGTIHCHEGPVYEEWPGFRFSIFNNSPVDI